MSTTGTRPRRRRFRGDSARPEAYARPRLGPRLAGAIRRRAWYAWRRLTVGSRTAPAEAAFRWLIRQGEAGMVPAVAGDPAGCPGATGGAIETAWAFGTADPTYRWARWLRSIQRPDGALPESTTEAPSLANTAWAVRGLLAVESDLPEVRTAALAACRYLHSCLDEGPLRPSMVGTSLDTLSLEFSRLACLYPLWQAAKRFERADWKQTVRRAADRGALSAGQSGSIVPSYALAVLVEALTELGRCDAAAELMRRAETRQRRDGSVPASGDVDWTSSAALAYLAACWYKLDRRDRADRAMRCLERRQSRTGGFRGGWGRGAAERCGRELTWTAKHYLDAARLQVQTAFDSASSHLPDRIDPADGRVQALRRWFASLPVDARVADVGCGRGRFLRHLLGWFPRAGLTGIDVSTTVLERLPHGVTALQGSLLRIDVADGTFDGAFAVESLEHALLPQQAVRELCRIVRPGGRLLIIDKHRARQPLSEHDPWERWFTPEELSGWLSRYCDEVTVRSVSHLEGRPGTELFLAASGKRTSLRPQDP